MNAIIGWPDSNSTGASLRFVTVAVALKSSPERTVGASSRSVAANGDPTAIWPGSAPQSGIGARPVGYGCRPTWISTMSPYCAWICSASASPSARSATWIVPAPMPTDRIMGPASSTMSCWIRSTSLAVRGCLDDLELVRELQDRSKRLAMDIDVVREADDDPHARRVLVPDGGELVRVFGAVGVRRPRRRHSGVAGSAGSARSRPWSGGSGPVSTTST